VADAFAVMSEAQAAPVNGVSLRAIAHDACPPTLTQ